MAKIYPCYYRTWFVVCMLLLFFPAGLVLMWKGNKFGYVSRILISAIGLATLYPFVQTIKKQKSLQETEEKQANVDLHL